MKLFLPILSAVTMIGLAVPAYAENDVNVEFINSLHAAGIGYSNEGQVVSAAKAMCGLMERGQRGLQVVGALQANNPGMSTDNAIRFARIAAASYCPEQLELQP